MRWINPLLMAITLTLVSPCVAPGTPDNTEDAKNQQRSSVKLQAKLLFRVERSDNLKFGSTVFRSLKFSPDAKLLTDTNRGGIVTVYNPHSGKKVELPWGPPKELGRVEFSPDGKRLLSVRGYSLSQWNLESGREFFGIVLGQNQLTPPVLCLGYHPSGKQFALALGRGGNESGRRIQLRDSDTGNVIREFPTEYGSQEFSFSPDGKRLAYGVPVAITVPVESVIKVVDVESGTELQTLKGHQQLISDLSYSPCGKWIASASDKTMRVWDAHTGQIRHTWQLEAFAQRLAWGPDGRWLTIGSSAVKRSITVRDIATGEEVLVIDTPMFVFQDLALSHNGTYLAATDSKHLSVWEISKAK